MSVEPTAPDAVRPLRELHRREMNCQIILDSWLGRAWVDAYLLRVDGRIVGYGLVGGVHANPKDTITEFYVLPPDRGAALPLFRKFVMAIDHSPKVGNECWADFFGRGIWCRFSFLSGTRQETKPTPIFSGRRGNS